MFKQFFYNVSHVSIVIVLLLIPTSRQNTEFPSLNFKLYFPIYFYLVCVCVSVKFIGEHFLCEHGTVYFFFIIGKNYCVSFR
jgi:hypothetical protein